MKKLIRIIKSYLPCHMQDDIFLKIKMLLIWRGPFREWVKEVWLQESGERLCCGGFECGCYGADYYSMWRHQWQNRAKSNDQ